MDRKLDRVKARGAVFGGLLAITFGDLSTDLEMKDPSVLLAFFATAVFLDGFELARTYVALHKGHEILGGFDTTDLRNLRLRARR